MGKMGKIEKLFVNSPSHSRQVSRHAEKLLRLVEFRAGQRYLDVGCGNGAAPVYLAQNYPLEVTGVDVDPDQIRAAKKQGEGVANARFLTIDGTQLPFEDGDFDIVSTNKVTHHIPNWEAMFVEMIRVLKTEGYFIYSDLVYPGWLAAVGKAVAGNHAGFPTIGALQRLIEQGHLSPVHLSTSFGHYEAVFRKH
jgi:ubiquinone/menaquinone biosynthesis C-methylase UbiE